MFRFIESIKVEEQKAFLLEYHQKRVNDTFKHFKKENPPDLLQIFRKLLHQKNGLFKLRILYDLQGNYDCEIQPYSVPHISDFQMINGDDLKYCFKYENRQFFTELKSEAKAEEIIIVQNGHITDTSFSNLIFFKNETWVTPSTFLLNGVQRQFLLKNNQIKETRITVENLKTFSHFRIINAMNDMNSGIVYPIEKIINLHG